MKSPLTWPEALRSSQFKGQWVALDHCIHDPHTRRPVRGEVVDADPEVTVLCARLREAGRSACTVFFCDADVVVEPAAPAPRPRALRAGL